MSHPVDPQARRSFLSRISATVASVGAAIAAGTSVQAQQPSGGTVWQPARHDDDNWLEQPSAKHRHVFDPVSAGGFARSLAFVNNYLNASRSAYNMADTDSAIVIVMRHEATGFAFDDAMWAKYSAGLSERTGYVDPATKALPTRNAYLSGTGATLEALTGRGVRLAVCQLATRVYATTIASKTGGAVDDVYKDLTEHLVRNGRMVPAGIIALNRAQERGYTFGNAS